MFFFILIYYLFFGDKINDEYWAKKKAMPRITFYPVLIEMLYPNTRYKYTIDMLSTGCATIN
ncbi:hypothetical protein GCM10025777_58360 [Membranihabitans marinus]